MYTDRIFGRLFDMVVHQLSIGSILAGSLLLSSALDTAPDSKSVDTPSLSIDFSRFSPAFAAFEDDLLFVAEEKAIAEPLLADNAQTLWRFVQGDEADVSSDVIPIVQEGFFSQFDGSASVGDLPSTTPERKTASSATRAKSLRKKIYAASELSFGPLWTASPSLATLAAQSGEAPQPLLTGGKRGAGPIATAKSGEAKKSPEVSVEEKALTKVSPEEQEPAKWDRYQVFGSLSLAGGLAYFGSLEATWMVGNELVALGSVNTPDATYEIEVTDLIGEVIVSIFDNQDQLIGEALVELADLDPGQQSHRRDLTLRPIDWDHAGEILHVHTLGQASSLAEGIGVKNIPVPGAKIQLYSFNQATTTARDGSFRFPNWRKSQSRTLALATHRGFRDSIFILDSKRPAQVPLLSERYLRALFSTLDEQGLFNQENRGLIYGSLQGLPDLAGYKVVLKGAQPIYFDGLNIAQRGLTATSANGLFAFVGLDDGDYEIGIEKDGVIIDHRVLAVEQGKVSPLIVNLQAINKSLQFYNPLNPSETYSEVQVSFFDGASTYKLDKKQRLGAQVPGGNEPNMIEYAVGAEVNRSFISRNRGFEKLPVVTDEKLLALAQASGLRIESGLLFAFIDSPVSYRAELVESEGERVIYFNQKGEQINPNSETPFGFIMGNFYQGLSTVRLVSPANEVLASDLVFSDHSSIAVINSYLLDSKSPLQN